MKLLLVDNDSDTLLELRQLCDVLTYDVTTVHCTRLDTVDYKDYDLIVLSGGFWYDDELKHLDIYAKELELIRATTTPLIGVCLGMQLMHVAFSGIVPLLEETQTGSRTITLTAEGQRILKLPEQLAVHKNHTRGIITVLPHFQVLGLSEGHLEIMRHGNLPLIGIQFHPEIGDIQTNATIMQRLIGAITS